MTSELILVANEPEQNSEAPVPEAAELLDPRALLAEWANSSDEWVRLLVAEVLATGRAVGESVLDDAYALFREEKALDPRALPKVPLLAVEARQDESAPALTLTRLSGVRGINALVSGAEIEPHEGLTILYGENGTGKTGYSRIFKALANSRTADKILGNIASESVEEQGATLEFKLAEESLTLNWDGELGVSPFTRMSIFDSPSVTTHVDEDLDYVYVPAALALFRHVTASIQAVTARIDAAIAALGAGSTSLLSRFRRGSSVYPLIETIGASTDLDALKSKMRSGETVAAELDLLTQSVAALRSNTTVTQIAALKSEERVLRQAAASVSTLLSLNAPEHNSSISKRVQLDEDYKTFRAELFAAADLPADPDDTWSAFVEAGETYKGHLVSLQAHDAERCLYCRQPLLEPARDLLLRYSEYLEDKISEDIRTVDASISQTQRLVAGIQYSDLVNFVNQYAGEEERPGYYKHVEAISMLCASVSADAEAGRPLVVAVASELVAHEAGAVVALANTIASIEDLEVQQANRAQVLADKESELLELTDAAELGKSWSLIEAQVKSAKESDQLRSLKRPISRLGRAVTELSKTASDQLINQSFDALFLEECEALRAPQMKLQFVGRDGKAQRRKVMTGKHKPSKVLSEGEQKVLALADFLAEARLAGITAPVIFDDPVSSLDHRRINEVAQRIARLAEDNQVIVFTHDILFASTLIGLFDQSKRCTYFQITDESGKGTVARATGPRTDSIAAIKKRINSAIEAARVLEGETRDALVRSGYNHVRAWCEVFTEDELLQGVTKRYRANVRMSTLPKIDGSKLDEIAPKVSEIFDIACRYIDGHSQSLVTLGVSPTLTGLEGHWAQLQELKRLNDSSSS